MYAMAALFMNLLWNIKLYEWEMSFLICQAYDFNFTRVTLCYMLFHKKTRRNFIHFSRVDQIHRADISAKMKIKFVIRVNKRKKIWKSTARCNKYISVFNPYKVEKSHTHSVYHFDSHILMCAYIHTTQQLPYIKGFANKCGIGIKCEIMKILNRISIHSSDFLIHEN